MSPNARGATAKSSFGNRLKTSAPIRLTAQPISPVTFFAAIRLPALPTAFSSAFCRTVQLLTMTTSASSSFAAFSWPAASISASTASESRTFIWQP